MDTKTIDAMNADLHQGGFIGMGGFYVRPFTHKKGEVYQGHAHYIDHVGNLVSGAVRVHWRDPDGTEGIVEMLVPSKIHMPAGRHHRIEPLEDSRWECWFAKAEADRIYGDDAQVRWTLEAND